MLFTWQGVYNSNATYGIMANKYVICKQVSHFGHRLSIRLYKS